MIARIVPFATYLAFIALAQSLKWLTSVFPGLQPSVPELTLWLYPVKIAVVLGLLAYFWPCYQELSFKGRSWCKDGMVAIAVGLVVYLAWVRMDWSWAMQGRSERYDPFGAGPLFGPVLAGLRLFGATMVVPIMEELFWRSFLLRYLISARFESVPLGTFTPFSCLVSVALFGVEHDLWLAGLMAGAAYTLLLYRTGQLWPCVLAHAVTNLALGLHVLLSQEWRWW